MGRRRQHRGGAGIVWIYNDVGKPLSPHQKRRGHECFVVWTLLEWACEAWCDQRQTPPGEREPIYMLSAMTNWFCGLDLPLTEAEVFRGPPVLSRRQRLWGA